MASRHPSDELLMSYASGTLNDAFALVLNCHMQFCPRCVSRVREMEEIGAALTESIPVEDIAADHGFYTRSMQRFIRDIGHIHTSEAPVVANRGGEFEMPGPLAAITRLRRETIPWKPVSDGIYRAELDKAKGVTSRLHFLKLDPAISLPTQTHRGSHLLLVLWGDYKTETGLVKRGDIHEIPSGTAHSFVAGLAEGMTCVAATEEAALAMPGSA